MKISATSTPSGVKATLMPSGSSQAAEPAVLRVQRGQRDAGHGRGQREGQVDQRIHQLLAGEAVAHQHPGEHQAEHGIDRGGQQRGAEGAACRRRSRAAP
jgi:hypothetical protein